MNKKKNKTKNKNKKKYMETHSADFFLRIHAIISSVYPKWIVIKGNQHNVLNNVYGFFDIKYINKKKGIGD